MEHVDVLLCELDEFDRWHDAKFPEPKETDPYRWRVEWRANKGRMRGVWNAAIAAMSVDSPEDMEGVLDGKWYCEDHPEFIQDHNGCNGAGIPAYARIGVLLHKIRQLDQRLREQQYAYGFLADLAMSAQGEAVAWADPDDVAEEKVSISATANKYHHQGTRYKLPLYTHPKPQSAVVDDAMVERAVAEIRKAKHTCFDRWTDHEAMRAALLAALGEGS